MQNVEVVDPKVVQAVMRVLACSDVRLDVSAKTIKIVRQPGKTVWGAIDGLVNHASYKLTS